MRLWYIGIVWCSVLGIQQGANCYDLGKSQANSYFHMKQNGGYEYGFNTDTGMDMAQTADESNEVTGHYMYYDKGIPYMVKYRAGKNGFQPEIIPADKINYEQFKLPTSNINTRRTHSNYRLSDHQLQAPKVSSFSGGQDETLNFVQNSLKTMQTQPMHLSFTSDIGEIQHPNGRYTTTSTTTLRPPHMAARMPPVTVNDVQNINNLSAHSSSNLESKQPYSFNYNADQSARSETADPLGNVVGSYSYYDEAGYHDISYKASDDTGFVVLGGNLAQQPQPRQLYRTNNFNFNNYRVNSRVTSNAFQDRNLGKRSVRTPKTTTKTTPPTTLEAPNLAKQRSLRKFRRFTKW